ncbi:MAG: acyl-CoA/acyl-ACP dehydrogenase, partial [Leptospiraceae bacterium]|nr:acyl-CoA/acyl-ACP dehydrogenase [Leptospiraceae bacterium]
MSDGNIKTDKTKVESCLKASGSFIEEVTENLAKKCSENGKVSIKKMDENQLVSYQLAWLTAEQRIAENFVNYAWNDSIGTSDLEKQMACTFAAEVVSHIRSEIGQRPTEFGTSHEKVFSDLYNTDINSYIEIYSKINNYESIIDMIVEKGHAGVYGLNEDHESFRDAFKKFAESQVMPEAEHVHRHDDFIPQRILDGLVDMGCFGLCIPETYGGVQPSDKPDNISMLVATEELSRGGLGIAGSLITRPEIVSKAILKGGTDEQKEKWLGKIAAGETMCNVAVTEPNYGSDVASISVTATKCDGGWKINGVKTWCTFAGYADIMMVLCRTESDLSLKHKGLSILLAEKPRSTGHSFEYNQSSGG